MERRSYSNTFTPVADENTQASPTNDTESIWELNRSLTQLPRRGYTSLARLRGVVGRDRASILPSTISSPEPPTDSTSEIEDKQQTKKNAEEATEKEEHRSEPERSDVREVKKEKPKEEKEEEDDDDDDTEGDDEETHRRVQPRHISSMQWVFGTPHTWDINQWDVRTEKRLGEGGHSTVWKAKWEPDGHEPRVVAVKVLHSGVGFGALAEALNSGLFLPHPNLIQYLGYYRHALTTHLVVEYAPGGCLSSALSDNEPLRGSLPLRLDIAKQIARGMNYLHSLDPPVLHRDLKCDNVLIFAKQQNRYQVKISDFGLLDLQAAEEQQHNRHHPNMLYVKTVPPELLLTGDYSSPGDVYQFGWLLWHLMATTNPLDRIDIDNDRSLHEFVAKRLNDQLLLPLDSGTPLSHIIGACLQADPKGRPTFRSILDMFEERAEDQYEAAERDKETLTAYKRIDTDSPQIEKSFHPIVAAILLRHVNAAKALLLDGNRNFDALPEAPLFGAFQGARPIHIACYSGNPDIVRLLLPDDKASWDEMLSALDLADRNPLHYACFQGRRDVLDLLFDLLPSDFTSSLLCQLDKLRRSPLYYAALQGRLEVLEVVRDKFPDLLHQSLPSGTLLHAASFGAHCQTVEWLLKKGADVNHEDQNGTQPLAWVRRGVNAGEVTALLLGAGADVNHRDKEGRTALMWHASSEESYGGVEELLKHPDINASPKDNSGKTALHMALTTGASKALLQHGVDVNAKDATGTTPLHYSFLNGHCRSAALLLQAGADPWIENNAGELPAHYAARSRVSAKIAKVFAAGAARRWNANGSAPIHYAASFGRAPTIRFLADLDPECVNARDAKGNTPLHCAAMRPMPSTAVIRALVQAGADLTLTDDSGRLALFGFEVRLATCEKKIYRKEIKKSLRMYERHLRQVGINYQPVDYNPPPLPDLGAIQQMFLNKALQLSLAGHDEIALNMITMIMQPAETSYADFAVVGLVHHRLRHFMEAMACYENASKLCPTDFSALWGLYVIHQQCHGWQIENPYHERVLGDPQLDREAFLDVEETMRNNLCSFVLSQDQRYLPQPVFMCHTCGLRNGTGLCLECALSAADRHKDHNVRFATFSYGFFCDCGPECRRRL